MKKIFSRLLYSVFNKKFGEQGDAPGRCCMLLLLNSKYLIGFVFCL